MATSARPHSGFTVREAVEADAVGIRNVFEACYGSSYTYPQFYDELELKRMIFGDGTLVLVAEDNGSRHIVGTASVMLEIGAYSDLAGEFGRLAVTPDSRGRGIGRALMKARVERVKSRLHVGLVEARVVCPWSARISLGEGFAPVGFMPLKLRFGHRREHGSLLVQHFGPALELRRNHPRVMPEAYPLATMALSETKLPPDVIVDEHAPPHPHGGPYQLAELSDTGYSSLLRIERGRSRRREVFGPLRLHYGFFKLQATSSDYLIAREGRSIAAAIGYTRDDVEDHVRVFELIQTDAGAIRVLLAELEERCRSWGTVTIAIDVSAYAPTMQRTLLEAGYLPAAYIPAFVFDGAERLDVIRMLKVLPRLQSLRIDVPDRIMRSAEMVLAQHRAREVLPSIASAVDRIALFERLSDEQRLRVAGAFGVRTVEPGELVFDVDQRSEEMFVVLEGELAIKYGVANPTVGRVGPGESLGEVSLLTETVHSAAAVATSPVTVGVLSGEALGQLVRQRPDIAVLLYHNIAVGLGHKLRRSGFDGLEPIEA